jgi:hypothetical protein
LELELSRDCGYEPSSYSLVEILIETSLDAETPFSYPHSDLLKGEEQGLELWSNLEAVNREGQLLD